MLETANTFITQAKQPFKLLSRDGDHEKKESLQVTPREMWLKKEKNLKIKFILILVLTHSLWLFQDSDKRVDEAKKTLSVTPGFHLLKVPSLIMTPLPHPGEKIKVSLFIGKKLIAKLAYLRPSNEINQMHTMANLEIPSKAAEKLKEFGEERVVKVLPYLFDGNSKANTKKREAIYEMDI